MTQTVRELIALLEKMPSNAEVKGNDSWGCTSEGFEPMLTDDGTVWLCAL